MLENLVLARYVYGVVGTDEVFLLGKNCQLYISAKNQHTSRSLKMSIFLSSSKRSKRSIIRAQDNNFIIDDTSYDVENPYYVLQEIMPQNVISRNYAGGLVGYMSYEAMKYFEPSLSLKSHKQFESFLFGVYKDGLVHDKMTNELFYFFYDTNRLSEIEALMKKKLQVRKPVITQKGDSLSREAHARVVNRVKEEILDGNTFQCQVGFKRKFSIKGNPLPIYEKLRQINPSPFMSYMKFGKKKIVGASP